MNEPNARYQSYLLRLWQDSPSAMWRASAQCIQTSEIVHFVNMDVLYAFLAAQTTRDISAEQSHRPQANENDLLDSTE